MKILIAEDEYTSQKVIEGFLTNLGQCEIVANGEEAVTAFKKALDVKKPYDLICMDIMMPKVNGQEALKQIRVIEKDIGIRTRNGVKVVMTTAMEDQKNVIEAFYKGGATSYVVKPIQKDKLLGEIKKMGFNV